ncbi:hypothetical protein GALMADRAFT_1300025 [Galerina marginata CBS 339.88]|uniref:Uncharacterized protein n=1 Tax=Galerina marginata (strain CBS 339.88) TaxID=685588 RepID=A0A067T4M2_GALM3|nr:hypothetical protein GALMADRAFT_1300025 [Galerina marginata CBS 339.88]
MWADICIYDPERFGGGQNTRIYSWWKTHKVRHETSHKDSFHFLLFCYLTVSHPSKPGTPHNDVVNANDQQMAPHFWVKVWIRERIGRETEHKRRPTDTHRRPALRITSASDNDTNSPTHTPLSSTVSMLILNERNRYYKYQQLFNAAGTSVAQWH